MPFNAPDFTLRSKLELNWTRVFAVELQKVRTKCIFSNF